MTGEFNLGIRAVSNHGPIGAKFFRDNRTRRFSSINILDWKISELGALFLYMESSTWKADPWESRQQAKRITNRIAQILALFPAVYKRTTLAMSKGSRTHLPVSCTSCQFSAYIPAPKLLGTGLRWKYERFQPLGN